MKSQGAREAGKGFAGQAILVREVERQAVLDAVLYKLLLRPTTLEVFPSLR